MQYPMHCMDSQHGPGKDGRHQLKDSAHQVDTTYLHSGTCSGPKAGDHKNEENSRVARASHGGRLTEATSRPQPRNSQPPPQSRHQCEGPEACWTDHVGLRSGSVSRAPRERRPLRTPAVRFSVRGHPVSPDRHLGLSAGGFPGHSAVPPAPQSSWALLDGLSQLL